MKKILFLLILFIMFSFITMESMACDPCTGICGNRVAKLEYDEDTQQFLDAEDVENIGGVSITCITFNDDDPPEPIKVTWQATIYFICGINVKTECGEYPIEFECHKTSGTICSPDGKGILHIDFCGDGLIAVELNSFTAQTDGTIVTLTWTTATETENLGFHIYRSIAKESDYVQITGEMILGAGSSDEAQNYTYTDCDIKSGNTYYYKLADVDFNGNINFHVPISITIEAVPTKYSLAQSYPNPFNPETAINYTLKEAGNVSLKIYNLQGRLVRTLVDQKKPVGSYSVMWNGTDDNGILLASGVYYYTLKVNGFEETKKLTFMK